MLEAPLLLAFTAGMVASVNPCAFSLLPAYLGLFIRSDDLTEPVERRLTRAVGVAASVSAGFVIVFTLAGLAIDALTGTVRRQLPWMTVTIGAVLVVAGAAVVAGWKPRLAIGGGRYRSPGRGFGSMVGFGASYAVVSLSCTIGPFLAVTGVALRASTFGGVASYLAYALGMGVIILALSVGAALTRPATAGVLRKASRFAPRVGGALMIVAGLYGIWYGRWELRVYGGNVESDPVVDTVEDLRIRLVTLVESFGALQLTAVVFGTVAATMLVASALRPPKPRPGGPDVNSTAAPRVDGSIPDASDATVDGPQR